MSTLRPRLSGGHGQARRRCRPAHDYADLFGGPARVARRQGRRARPVRARRAASVRPAGQSLSRPRRPRLARQCAPLRGAGARRRRHRARRDRRRSGPQVVHAHDWQAALAPAYLHYADGRARARRSPSTTSPSRAIIRPRSSPARPAAGRADDRRRRIFRRRRLSEGRPPARPTASPPSRRPMRARS